MTPLLQSLPLNLCSNLLRRSLHALARVDLRVTEPFEPIGGPPEMKFCSLRGLLLLPLLFMSVAAHSGDAIRAPPSQADADTAAALAKCRAGALAAGAAAAEFDDYVRRASAAEVAAFAASCKDWGGWAYPARVVDRAAV